MKLKVGNSAPIFEALDESGSEISLTDFLGKKVILFFYPKDMTMVCTVEACNLKENYAELQSRGFEVIGVSADNEISHRQFILKHGLPFHLIADTNKRVINQYDVWGQRGFLKLFNGIRRTTFVINEEGMIEAIYDKVKSKSHTQQILDGLNQ